MNAETREAAAAAAVHETLQAWASAVRRRDLPAILAHYAPEVVAFDAVGALRFTGFDAYARHWEACMAMCPGDMIFELRDVDVAVAGDLAVCSWVVRCGHTDGAQEKSGWMRSTAALRRPADRWRIVHEHHSVPFDPESGKALFDLIP